MRSTSDANSVARGRFASTTTPGTTHSCAPFTGSTGSVKSSMEREIEHVALYSELGD